MAVINRITRQAGQTVPAPTIDGALQGRCEYLVANAYAPEPQWWKVILAPLASSWNGKETSNSATSIQTADTWARIKVGDGETPPIYVSWPAVGGSIWCFGQSVSVAAFPSAAELNVSLVGPSWGVIIDNDPIDTGDRDGWLGLYVQGQLAPVSTVFFNIPPYAKACRVNVGASGFSVDFQQQTTSGLVVQSSTLIDIGLEDGKRVTLNPAAARIGITNVTAVSRAIYIIWEISP